jgi:3-phytase
VRTAISTSLIALSLAACATTPAVIALPATNVPAIVETDPVGTAARDAADDPAIWRNPANPAASLVVGTDKRAGIHVYGLDGRARSFVAAGEVNNVDLRDGVRLGGRDIILVGASNRNSLTEPRLSLFTLDGATGQIADLASFATGASGEAYGFCFGRHVAGLPRAYIVTKQGQVLEFELSEGASGAPAIRLARQFAVITQPEGCVVDDRTGQLYLGEEDVGIWRFDLTAQTPVAIRFAMVVSADGLVADVEGLALAPEGARGGLLVASSQGDNAYALFDLATGALSGRFRINGGAIDGTFDTDGIELMLGDFGPRYPGGLFVAQDGNNLPAAQNFKYLSWDAVRTALGMGPTPR